MIKWFKRFTHDVLGWCDGDGSAAEFDGCSNVSRCSQCDRVVFQDSTGSWF